MKQREKANSHKTFIVRLSPSLYSKLKAEAQKRDVSLAYQLEEILADRYDKTIDKRRFVKHTNT